MKTGAELEAEPPIGSEASKIRKIGASAHAVLAAVTSRELAYLAKLPRCLADGAQFERSDWRVVIARGMSPAGAFGVALLVAAAKLSRIGARAA